MSSLKIVLINILNPIIMIKVFFLFVFTAATAGLFADNAPISISPSSKWIIIDKEKTKFPSLKVTIWDQQGNAIVKENIKKTTKFNLKYVPDGNYKIETEDLLKIDFQEITIDNGKISSTTNQTIYKPYFNDKLGFIDMNLMAQGKPVKLTLRNANGQILMEESIQDQVSITRRFNLSKLEEGQYSLEVDINDRLFSKIINK